jgi:hypothetical protein
LTSQHSRISVPARRPSEKSPPILQWIRSSPLEIWAGHATD